jgi:hypothetical protein
VFAGRDTGGRVLETRPFEATGQWTDPANPEGWPPAWWDCGVTAAQYRWEIQGVYSFHVTAARGSWTLDITVGQDGRPSVHWEYDACA